MAKYQLKALRSPRRLDNAGAFTVALCLLLAALADRSECSATRPSNHGVPDDKEPEPASLAMEAFFQGHPNDAALPESTNFTGGVSPAMAAFFRGQPEAEAATAAELPEARNIPNPSSTSSRPPSPRRDRRSSALIAVGVVFGVLGFALLVAITLALAVHVRRSGAETEPGSGFVLVRKESGSELRLGIV